MSIFSKIYEIGKTIHDTIKEINILDEIYKQDERIYKGSLLNQIDEMENSANEAENIIHKEINLEKNSQKLKQKQGLFRAKKYAALFAKHHKPETDILLKPAANIGAAEIEKARRFSMFENSLVKKSTLKLKTGTIPFTEPPRCAATAPGDRLNRQLKSARKATENCQPKTVWIWNRVYGSWPNACLKLITTTLPKPALPLYRKA